MSDDILPERLSLYNPLVVTGSPALNCPASMHQRLSQAIERNSNMNRILYHQKYAKRMNFTWLCAGLMSVCMVAMFSGCTPTTLRSTSASQPPSSMCQSGYVPLITDSIMPIRIYGELCTAPIGSNLYRHHARVRPGLQPPLLGLAHDQWRGLLCHALLEWIRQGPTQRESL
jgi:hypothetical protein